MTSVRKIYCRPCAQERLFQRPMPDPGGPSPPDGSHLGTVGAVLVWTVSSLFAQTVGLLVLLAPGLEKGKRSEGLEVLGGTHVA